MTGRLTFKKKKKNADMLLIYMFLLLGKNQRFLKIVYHEMKL